MMHEDYLGKIKSAYNQFTKAEKKVADYVLANPKEVLFMSISDLGLACGVGDTSVFRFCRTMNVKGYQEFKMLLSLSLNTGNTEGKLFAGKDINLNDSIRELSQKVLATNIGALNETYSLLDFNEFDKAVTYLHDAERIIFFGVGASALASLKAMNKFLHIIPNVYTVQDSHMQAMVAATMGEKDVAVLFSYSGSTKDTVEVAELAKKNNARIISVTRYVKSPLTQFSDITLLCGANEGPLQGGSTSVEVSQMFIVDLLYSEFYKRYYSDCAENNEKTSAAVSNRIY